MGTICQKIQEQILEYITDGLPTKEIDLLKNHISKCEICRNYLTALQSDGKLLSDFAEIVQPVISRIENNVIAAVGCQKMAKDVKVHFAWGAIMRNSVIRVAAAIVVMGVFAGLFYVHSTPAYSYYSITDLPMLMDSIKTMHMKGFCTYDSRLEYPEQNPVYIPIEFWIDLEEGKIRKNDIVWNFGQDEYSCSLLESIWHDQYAIIINHTEKSAKYLKPAEITRKLLVKRNYGSMLQRMYGDPDQLSDFSIVGREEINDIDFDIWERETDTEKIKVWMSPVLGEVSRYECWYHKVEDNWTIYYVITNIELDVELQKNIFESPPPSSYELLNTEETATTIPALLQDSVIIKKDDSVLSLNIHLVFTLSDGTVILAWSNQDTSANNDMVYWDSLFESLEIGGLSPKLPIEIYAIKPVTSDVNDDVIYKGYHLAHTQKGGKYYEWDIYLPISPLPYQNIRGYKILTRNNSTSDEVKFRLAVDRGIPINSFDDFEIFVVGAAMELSDNPDGIPYNLNYDNVLDLAARLRVCE